MTPEQKAALEAASLRVHAAADAIERAAEGTDLAPLQRALDDAVADGEKVKAEIADTEAEEARDANRAAARAAFPKPDAAAPSQPDARGGTPSVRVVREERTYRRGGDHQFFSDAYRMRYLGDQDATERILRHGAEQMVELREITEKTGAQFRDVGTPAFAGLTVPQYLIDQFAPIARAGRPFLNTLQSSPLPAKGMVVSISRITTGSAVAVQATENANVQETDIDDTQLDVPVRTYAGQQDVSRQALERSEMVEDVVAGDLIADYHTKLDAACLNSDGTGGTHLGIRSVAGIITVTYTDASPTVAELYPKGADALQQISKQRNLPATTWIQAPRRWGWFTAAVDSGGRPLVVPDYAGPFNAAAVGLAGEYGQVSGKWHGRPVIEDANMLETLGGGTEDVILGYRAPDLRLWEEGDGSPRRLRFEETLGNQLTVKLVVYGYSAFTAGRYPKAVAVITGTGLAAPTF